MSTNTCEDGDKRGQRADASHDSSPAGQVKSRDSLHVVVVEHVWIYGWGVVGERGLVDKTGVLLVLYVFFFFFSSPFVVGRSGGPISQSSQPHAASRARPGRQLA